MQTKKLAEGRRYKIRYRKPSNSIAKKSNWYNSDMRPLNDGYGVLVERCKGQQLNPHKFRLDADTSKSKKTLVDVTSNGIVEEATVIEAASGMASKNKAANKKILAIKNAEERIAELEPVVILLAGLGVIAIIPDEDDPALLIKWEDSAKFKVLLNKVYGKTLFDKKGK